MPCMSQGVLRAFYSGGVTVFPMLHPMPLLPRDTTLAGRFPASTLPEAGMDPQLWEAATSTCARVAHKLAGRVLDAAERERAAAFRREEDRDTYVVAHVGLRLLLGSVLGAEPGDVVLERRPCPGCGEPHGRPAVVGEPVQFSLSHTRRRVLLALAATPVGVDIEQIPALSTVDDVMPALHPREQEELSALSENERAVALGRIWVRKEAYFKGLGIGLARGLDRDYLGTDQDSCTQPDGWTVRDIRVDGGCCAAIAIAAS